MENYFNSLISFSNDNDLEKLYTEVKAANFHPRKDEALAWAQTTVMDTIKLFMSSYFPLSDQSESDILRRIWSLIDSVFDHSEIKSRRYFYFSVSLTILLTTIQSGEKLSTSSASGLNSTRTIASINQAVRKSMGRKVDMVYKLGPNEYGCMECGKNENDSTKKLTDSMFKFPIVT